jgi:p24 family protein delta-1
MSKIVTLLLTLTLCVLSIESLMFYLPPNNRKCLKEEIHKDILVKGDYDISHVLGHKTKLEVLDSRGHILYNKDDATKGKFAFTTDEYDVFQVCFETRIVEHVRGQEAVNKEVALFMKHGTEAKDYEQLAKAEKLKPLEIELRRLEDLSQDIVNDFAYMKAREEEMRSTNESTNSKVLYFSIFSMSCLLGLAVWQVLYLRRYFKAKKLID